MMCTYRCAACGSPHVVCEQQKEGYNYVKGAIGTAVLGVGGAVAGVNGKSKQVYKCADCGLTLDHPMESSIKLWNSAIQTANIYFLCCSDTGSATRADIFSGT